MWNKFWEFIGKSVLTKVGAGGKISTTRIQSYLILGSILTATAVFLIIDVINAIEKWSLNQMYTVPTEHITLFGMVLAHHLALLGINKNSETKTAQVYKDTPPEQTKDTSKDIPKQKEEIKKEIPPVQKDSSLDEEGEVH